jgi:hypothetical protein
MASSMSQFVTSNKRSEKNHFSNKIKNVYTYSYISADIQLIFEDSIRLNRYINNSIFDYEISDRLNQTDLMSIIRQLK